MVSEREKALSTEEEEVLEFCREGRGRSESPNPKKRNSGTRGDSNLGWVGGSGIFLSVKTWVRVRQKER